MISIIIPVYNAEKTIKKCLDSIINQTYQKFEVICINDGSKDNSELVINDYCIKDSRIKVINKENSGVSDTRNLGIENSSGKFILFVDADDYISSDYLENMISIMKTDNADIIITAYTELRGMEKIKKTIYNNVENSVFDVTFPKEILNFFSTYEYNPCWKQLIKRKLLIENNIRFNKNIKYGEDMLFSFECYMKSKKTLYSKHFGYYYYINASSVMNKKDIKSLQKYYFDNRKTTKLILEKYNASKVEQQYLYYKTLKVFNAITWKLILSTDDYKIWKKIVVEAKEQYKDIFDVYSNEFGNMKEKISIFLLKYNLCYIYYILKK